MLTQITQSSLEIMPDNGNTSTLYIWATIFIAVLCLLVFAGIAKYKSVEPTYKNHLDL